MCFDCRYWINDRYVVDNGVREVAELNNIIVIYPQVKPSNGNSDGCWDWWGYSGADFGMFNNPRRNNLHLLNYLKPWSHLTVMNVVDRSGG